MTLPDSVQVIDNFAFNECRSLVSVYFPEGLLRIEYAAFAKCSSLVSINLPESLISIGLSSFSGCINLRKVTIPSKVTVLWNWTFNGCTALETVNIPNGFIGIETSVFSYCRSLKNVMLPESLTYIRGEAFQSCSNLTKITIPANVTEIGDNAFKDCEALETVNILALNPTLPEQAVFENTPVKTVRYAGTEAQWKSSGWVDMFTSSPSVTFSYDPGEFTIENGVLEKFTMGNETDITVPYGVTSIGNKVFDSCVDLTSMTLPDTVTSIGKSAFYGCTGLTSVTLPDSLTSIEGYAFGVCPNLSSVTILTKFPNVDSTAFSFSKVGTVNYAGTESEWNASGWKDVFDSSVTINYNFSASTVKITTQPTNQSMVLGRPVTLSLTATGEGLTYQWYFKKAGQTSFSPWNGHTQASETCTPNATWDGIQLYCVVKDSTGITEQSDTVTVSVLSIATQPKDVTVAAGKNATFTVKATGSGLKYQWQYRKSGATAWSNWNGRTTASTTSTANSTWNGMQVRCVVTDGADNKVTSNAATITIASSLTITTQPQNQFIVLGKSATLSLTATGEGLTYQWYFKKAGQSSFSPWNGHTQASETCKPNATWDGIQLYCVVKDSTGITEQSDTVTVSVLSIATQPKDVTVAAGKNATFTVKATGSGLKYQWQYRKSGATAWSNWNGRTTASTTSTANSTWNGMQVRCVVTDGADNKVTSNAATITIASSLTITTQPQNQFIVLGKSATLSLTATGEGLTYQWYFKKAGQSSFSPWNGHTKATETATPNATWDGIQLYCVVKDSAGNTKQSDTVTVNILSIATQPANVTVAVGSNATFTVKATGAGLKYQWQYKKSGATAWSNWNGRTTASTTATANATWQGMQVRCVVTDSAGNKVTSSAATITIK